MHPHNKHVRYVGNALHLRIQPSISKIITAVCVETQLQSVSWQERMVT